MVENLNKLRHLHKILLSGSLVRWLLFYLQRSFLRKNIRDFLWQFVKFFLVLTRGHNVKELACSANKELNNSGFFELGQVLSDDQVKEIFEFMASRDVYDPYAADQEVFLPPLTCHVQPFHVAHHKPIDVVNAPHLLKLANDQRILDIAAEFLGVRPTIGYLAAWWSFPTEHGPMHAENFHRDVDDWKFLKLFVALTDFSSTNGPHIYVSGSSKSSDGRESIRRYDDDEIIALFGQAAIKSMTPKAGEAFLEDTFGFHKGQPVNKGYRLMFQVTYSISPLPYSPKKPVKTSIDREHTYDTWINRLYLSDKAEL